MRIALAQYGGYGDHVARHADLIRAHIACDVIVFPELSLTGYTTREAADLAMTLEDPALGVLQAACDDANVAALIGVPLRVGGGVCIAKIVLRPGAPLDWYAKRHLHADERPFFGAGDRAAQVNLGHDTFGLGICYEATLKAHWEHALPGARAYLVSVAKPARAMQAAHATLSRLARERGLPVLMVNAWGPVEDFVCCGQSAWWDAQGALIEEVGAQAATLVCEL